MHPPLATGAFVSRLSAHLAAAIGLLALSLALGMFGYIELEGMQRRCVLNAAMLLGGMGPADAPVTNAGKLFAGFYALYAGLVFIITAALIFTPIAHRILHKFHSGHRAMTCGVLPLIRRRAEAKRFS